MSSSWTGVGRLCAIIALVAFVVPVGWGVVACTPEPRPSVDVRRPESSPSAVLIEDVAVLDVASGRRLPGRDVLIQAGRIAAIGASGSVAVPEDAQILNASGATLLPGLIDMHGHIDANGAATWEGRFPDHEANLRSYLYCGVTTVFDPSDASAAAFSRRDAVAAGRLLGPRIFTSGPILTAEEGHPIALVRALAPWWIGWYIAPRVAVATGSVEAAHQNVDRLVETAKVDGHEALYQAATVENRRQARCRRADTGERRYDLQNLGGAAVQNRSLAGSGAQGHRKRHGGRGRAVLCHGND